VKKMNLNNGKRNSRWENFPSRLALLVPCAILLAWAAWLGIASFWFWTSREALPKEQSFLLTAASFGALGGLASAIEKFRGYVWGMWVHTWKGVRPPSERKKSDSEMLNSSSQRETVTPPGSPFNNYVVNPLSWPLLGAAFGLVLPLLFLDHNTHLFRVALLGFGGGLFWSAVARKLPHWLGLKEK